MLFFLGFLRCWGFGDWVISLIFLGASGEVFGLITSFPLFWVLVVIVSGVVVVVCFSSVVLLRGGIFGVVAIPSDWKATNALYEFFVVFVFLGLVLGFWCASFFDVFGGGEVVGASPIDWKATHAMYGFFVVV